MALYRMEVKIIGRSRGFCVVAAAAYRAGEKLYDERNGMTHDYTAKAGRVEHLEILAPESAPEWVYDRERLWNAVEAKEARKDAQLARELVLSLPRELDTAQRKALVREFLQREYVSKGMIADVALHLDTARDGGENPHAHVLLTLRRIEGDGFGPKAREWNPQFAHGQNGEWVKEKETLIGHRTRWAEYVNRALADAGSPARVDHRSLQDRGIVRQPEPKLGKAHHIGHKHPECAAKVQKVNTIRFLNRQRRSRARAPRLDPWELAQRAEYEARQFYQLGHEGPSLEYQGRIQPPPEKGPGIDR